MLCYSLSPNKSAALVWFAGAVICLGCLEYSQHSTAHGSEVKTSTLHCSSTALCFGYINTPAHISYQTTHSAHSHNRVSAGCYNNTSYLECEWCIGGLLFCHNRWRWMCQKFELLSFILVFQRQLICITVSERCRLLKKYGYFFLKLYSVCTADPLSDHLLQLSANFNQPLSCTFKLTWDVHSLHPQPKFNRT